MERGLERRNAVWEEVKAANPGNNQVAVVGEVNDTIAVTVADQMKDALTENPETIAVFAPFDEFAKGAVLAIGELGLNDQVRVYSADISTTGIAMMTADDSPWAATAATDPGNVGRITIRAAYLAAQGEELPNSIIIPPTLVTREQLLEAEVTNMLDLVEAFPDFTTNDLLPVN